MYSYDTPIRRVELINVRQVKKSKGTIEKNMDGNMDGGDMKDMDAKRLNENIFLDRNK